MTLNVLWRSRLGADEAAELGLDGPFSLRIEVDAEAAEGHADWAEVLVDGSPTAALLDGARLGRVIVPYAGIDAALRAEVLARPHLRLHNSHFNAGFVAQHALALLLACANRVPAADKALRAGDWRPRYSDAFDSRFLGGRRCLLAGYGAIGRELEPRVRGLGMEVTTLRRSRGADDLHRALAEVEVVLISLPATPETEGLFGDAAFAAMRPGTILVNVGRASVIDQHALYRALTEGALFAAGLDVWWRYPESREARAHTFPADAPLHELPNLVMSPHRANQAEAWRLASFRDVARTLAAIAAGEERNRVDPARGY